MPYGVEDAMLLLQTGSVLHRPLGHPVIKLLSEKNGEIPNFLNQSNLGAECPPNSNWFMSKNPMP